MLFGSHNKFTSMDKDNHRSILNNVYKLSHAVYICMFKLHVKMRLKVFNV